MVNIELAKLDPSSIYKKPTDIVRDKSLTRDQKIDILKRWAYDEREMEVAEEENMIDVGNHQGTILDEILKSLLELGVEGDQDAPPPTKQG